MAQDIEKVDPATGEIMTMTEQPLAVQLQQAELNQAVTTAKSFPRSITRAVENIMTLATLDEESAKECVYALPRGGKPIKGPSVRFAEIVASQWGNCHTGSRIVAVDKFDKVVVAEGVFMDLETGMKRTAQIRRRISDRDGRLFNDDMITVTGNAAASIAMREAILKGIPKAVWRKAYERCEGVIAGDIKTLAVRRDEAIKAFAVWGVKPEQLFSALEIGGLDDLGLDHLGTLTAMFKAIKAGEQKVEDYFPAFTDQKKATDAAKGTAAKLGKIAETGNQQQKNGAKANEQGAGTKGKDQGKATEGAGGEGRDAGSAGGKVANGSDQGEGPRDERNGDEDDASGSARENAGDDGQDDGGRAGDGAEAGASTEDRVFTDEEIEAAYQRGLSAKSKGVARKAMPPEWRGEGFEALADAWVRGWQDG
ncbi:MAG: hypothetical protein BGO05_05240 [Rhizobiales bacterium 63-7]|nr:MAG: hypothetical protein BGO05_05240 [Rhizobiales bacterium 63-7]